MLTKHQVDHPADWDKHLSIVATAYNLIVLLIKTDLVTKRLNYISNLQNLYLVLRNIKLLLYYIITSIKNSRTNKVNRPKFILSHLLFSLETI